MDKGILESDPTLAKLNYCIAVTKEVREKIVHGLNELLGVDDIVLESPLPNTYPEKNPYGENTIAIGRTSRSKFGMPIIFFSLTQLPGCCGVLVSHNMLIHKDYRNKGVGTFLQGIKEEIAKDNGYTSMLATVVESNKAEIHILEKAGWEPESCFINNRTGNTVWYYTKSFSNNIGGGE